MSLSAIIGVPPAACSAARSAPKRCFDLAVAMLALILLSPVLLLVAVAIFVESGGPVIFRQVRAGQGGRRFTILKFRTMLAQDGAAIWTTRNDRRVTPLGAFLRRTSIDELPQLFNVLIGDMSIVGPRPHPLELDSEYQPLVIDYDARLQVRPGLTGLAQVSDLRGGVSNVETMQRRVDADLRYISEWSLGLDLAIVLQTVPHLLTSGNAY